MINSLKRKVFWSILLSAAGVLLAILLGINGLKAAQTVEKRESILDSALMMLPPEPGAEKGLEDLRGGGRDRFELLRSASEEELGVLQLDAQGAVKVKAGCADQLEDEIVSAIAAAAFTDADGRGKACDYEYKAIPVDGGMTVSFLDAAALRLENGETALVSLAAFAVACCLFALLAHLLTRIIVKPVEENVQAQKRFVADASHELKTPLAVIDANAAVLEQTVGQNKWLDYIKEQTQRMAGLVRELLQLSDLEERGTPAPPEPFDAAEAILTAALPFESVAFERGLRLETDMPDTLNMSGSRKDLEQLAGILIDNAIKHSAQGGTVRVCLTAVEARQGRKGVPVLELRVSNSGDEIPPEAMTHIFDRFYRADESRTYKDNSYGLGLSIAKGLAERNSGSIAAVSQNGLTVFTLRLPMR